MDVKSYQSNGRGVATPECEETKRIALSDVTVPSCAPFEPGGVLLVSKALDVDRMHSAVGRARLPRLLQGFVRQVILIDQKRAQAR